LDSSPLSFLVFCCIKEVPTPAPIAIPTAIHKPRLPVATPIAAPIPIPKAIPAANLLSFFIFYYLCLTQK
jgi:hypothetical protein